MSTLCYSACLRGSPIHGRADGENHCHSCIGHRHHGMIWKRIRNQKVRSREDQKEGFYQLEVIVRPALDMNNVSRNPGPNRYLTAVALSNKGCAISL
jgi:hypothetical protein